MKARLVVCFCWQERDSSADEYLDGARRVSDRLTLEDGLSISWGADRYAFSFHPDVFPRVLSAVLELLRVGRTLACGMSQRSLSSDKEYRSWGPGLVVAEQLALAARPGELLLDSAFDAIAAGTLVTSGTIPVQIGQERVEAALMIASSAPAAGYRSSFPPAEPPEPVTVRREARTLFAPDAPTPAEGLPSEPRWLDDSEVESAMPTPVAMRSDVPAPRRLDEVSVPDRSTASEGDASTASEGDTSGDEADAREARESEAVADTEAADDASADRPTFSEMPIPSVRPFGAASDAVEGEQPSPPPAEKTRPAAVALQETTQQVVAVTEEQLRAAKPATEQGAIATGLTDPQLPELPSAARRSRRLSNPPPKPESNVPRAESRAPRLSEPPPKPTASAAPERVSGESDGSSAQPKQRRSMVLSTPPPKPSRGPGPSTDDHAGEDRPSVVTRALREGDLGVMMRFADDFVEGEHSSDLNARLEAMTQPVEGSVERGLLCLREAARIADRVEAPHRGRARLALAVALVKAGRSRLALAEVLEALTHARASEDKSNERACVRLLSQLAKSGGREALAARWQELESPLESQELESQELESQELESQELESQELESQELESHEAE
jgi:hypothetical protein